MNIKINVDDFRVKPGQKIDLSQVPTRISPLYKNKGEYKDLLKDYRDEIKELQNMMYAHDRYAVADLPGNGLRG